MSFPDELSDIGSGNVSLIGPRSVKVDLKLEGFAVDQPVNVTFVLAPEDSQNLTENVYEIRHTTNTSLSYFFTNLRPGESYTARAIVELSELGFNRERRIDLGTVDLRKKLYFLLGSTVESCKNYSIFLLNEFFQMFSKHFLN